MLRKSPKHHSVFPFPTTSFVHIWNIYISIVFVGMSEIIDDFNLKHIFLNCFCWHNISNTEYYQGRIKELGSCPCLDLWIWRFGCFVPKSVSTSSNINVTGRKDLWELHKNNQVGEGRPQKACHKFFVHLGSQFKTLSICVQNIVTFKWLYVQNITVKKPDAEMTACLLMDTMWKSRSWNQ